MKPRKKTKRTLITIIALLVLAIGASSAYAVSYIAEKNAIGGEAALNFALVDAGLLPEEAAVKDIEFKYQNGQFVYEVEFTANGIEYEYLIQSKTGEVLKKESEQISGYQPPAAEPEVQNEEQPAAEETIAEDRQDAPVYLTQAEAEQVTLDHAGLKETEITIRKIHMETENGIKVYDIEFYTSTMEYEYEIDAITGEIREHSVEQTRGSETGEEQEPAKAQTEEAEAKQEVPGQEDSEPQQETVTYISIEHAKQTALSHAGQSGVTFTKAKLEREDGRMIYDIEFYAGDWEYEYEIDAISGGILDYDSERIGNVASEEDDYDDIDDVDDDNDDDDD